jgi:hypothetical protein
MKVANIHDASSWFLFENRSTNRALTFNVYSPPEYPPGEKD